MMRKGVLVRDPAPCYYVYRLMMDGHAQTGLVAAASIAEYETNSSASTSTRRRTRKPTACARSTR